MRVGREGSLVEALHGGGYFGNLLAMVSLNLTMVEGLNKNSTEGLVSTY